jgi:hypothetical protein
MQFPETKKILEEEGGVKIKIRGRRQSGAEGERDGRRTSSRRETRSI